MKCFFIIHSVRVRNRLCGTYGVTGSDSERRGGPGRKTGVFGRIWTQFRTAKKATTRNLLRHDVFIRTLYSYRTPLCGYNTKYHSRTGVSRPRNIFYYVCACVCVIVTTVRRRPETGGTAEDVWRNGGGGKQEIRRRRGGGGSRMTEKKKRPPRDDDRSSTPRIDAQVAGRPDRDDSATFIVRDTNLYK